MRNKARSVSEARRKGLAVPAPKMAVSFHDRVDPAHRKVNIMAQNLCKEIWEDKYRKGTEQTPSHTFRRVARAIYAKDADDHMELAYEAMDAGLWMPGGRIIAGAGTGNRVTLMNCYVNRKLEDSLDDIMRGVSDAALTQQQGGGIGTDFSTLRPSGAVLQRTGAVASGPLPFMDMWHSMCSTIMSAGSRRGAMMGTLSDTHPDLLEFITAKQQKGRMTNFNVSVLVSDALMAAVDEDEDWLLYFNVPPRDRTPELTELDFVDDNDVQQYVYRVIKARELWSMITRNTYEWSEPGIIFIDRINDLNNLKYCEEIRCTNPCGEQPLPPNGTCNLGAINLSRCVKRPFSDDAEIDWDLIADVVRVGQRFLDNVIDVTQYPLLAQEAEEKGKRRTGLGISGLADMLAQMGLRYGSAPAVSLAERVMQHIALTAYDTSMKLAEERGAFPLFQKDAFINDNFAGINLSTEYHDRIRKHGIRNGVLLTIAPTGTTSILYGNISAGVEPVFAHASIRKVRQPDNTFKEYTNYSYNSLLYRSIHPGISDLPSYMVEANDLTIEDHVITQATVQRWVDASVSKTINIAENTSYDDFRKVYDLAYALGCKGCTTYRPSEVRGSILSRTSESSKGLASETVRSPLAARSEVLQGLTHKIRWPSMSSALYVTVNQSADGYPFEVFFNSKDARTQEWMVALSLMITAILRKGDGDVQFIAEELGSVHSTHDTAWIKIPGEEKSRFFGSIISYIGFILGKDFTALGAAGVANAHHAPTTDPSKVRNLMVNLSVERCPQCQAPALHHQEGCKTCSNCGYSNCS